MQAIAGWPSSIWTSRLTEGGQGRDRGWTGEGQRLDRGGTEGGQGRDGERTEEGQRADRGGTDGGQRRDRGWTGKTQRVDRGRDRGWTGEGQRADIGETEERQRRDRGGTRRNRGWTGERQRVDRMRQANRNYRGRFGRPPWFLLTQSTEGWSQKRYAIYFHYSLPSIFTRRLPHSRSSLWVLFSPYMSLLYVTFCSILSSLCSLSVIVRPFLYHLKGHFVLFCPNISFFSNFAL